MELATKGGDVFGRVYAPDSLDDSRYNSRLRTAVGLSKSTVDALFTRTIKFLLHQAPNSPTLKIDAQILGNKVRHCRSRNIPLQDICGALELALPSSQQSSESIKSPVQRNQCGRQSYAEERRDRGRASKETRAPEVTGSEAVLGGYFFAGVLSCYNISGVMQPYVVLLFEGVIVFPPKHLFKIGPTVVSLLG